EHAGHARQPRREDESLEVLASGDGVGEDHQEARVPFHRPADVADQDQRPAAEPWTPTVQPHQLPARTDGVSRCSAQVDPAALGRPQTARLTLGHPPRRLFEQAPDLLGLLPGHLVEVLVAEELLRAVAAGAGWNRAGVLLAVHLRAAQAKGAGPGLGTLRRHRKGSAAAG